MVMKSNEAKFKIMKKASKTFFFIKKKIGFLLEEKQGYNTITVCLTIPLVVNIKFRDVR